MKPDYEELLKGCTTWRGNHKGIDYEIKFHGYNPESEFMRHGIWNFYIILNSEQYPDFDGWRIEIGEYGYPEPGPNWYYDWFHSGITFSESGSYRNRDGNDVETAKVGCDYNHIWDEEAGHPECFTSVEYDVKSAIDSLLNRFPKVRIRSPWSGKYGTKDEMVECRNGCFKHPSDDIDTEKYPGWSVKDD